MTIKVALHHRTHYAFDRPVGLSPHEVRLRPAAHCRTPIESYSLKVKPAKHFLNWQQDPYGNWVARLVFPDKARELEITVDMVLDMTVINPFDFFVDPTAESFPFVYTDENARELAPYLELDPETPLLAQWVHKARSRFLGKPVSTIDLLIAVNHMVRDDVEYLVRMESGIQTPEQTLERAKGSCRDSAWLLVQILRRLGIAARFVSGYLVQLAGDVKSLEGPSGPEKDFTDLHAWAEAYLPGAGWIGLDATSGLLAGEGHIPLASAALPTSAAPVTGMTEVAETKLTFAMSVTRIHEDPRVTRPFSEAQWSAIDLLGRQVDRELADGDVRLTVGGEPTFVSIDDMEGPEWNFTAMSEKKLELGTQLLYRLRAKFAPGGLLHFGQGKWYPGEPLPRWALSCFWRKDGVALWEDQTDDLPSGDRRFDAMLEGARGQLAPRQESTEEDARRLAEELAEVLGLSPEYVIATYEDPWRIIRDEANLPINVDPFTADTTTEPARRRLGERIAAGLGKPLGYVLPLKALARGRATGATQWASSPWPLRREKVFLIEGDSPMGYRLPLASLPEVLPEDEEPSIPQDPFDRRDALGKRRPPRAAQAAKRSRPQRAPPGASREVVKTALCVEVRKGQLHVFLPPVPLLEDFISLIASIESTVQALGLRVRLEGYAPPDDPRLGRFAITPDPGVIEVNIHPAADWDELKQHVETLYDEARLTRLGTEKFMLDGRHTGTGGGNHVTLGGPSAAESPLLRRPDLLRSLITYWQNHPALSYLFSGMFLGPTSQSPRVDEARDDTLYELGIAFEQLEASFKPGEPNEKPWLVDRILRNFLVDLTGNTHRAEFSIDKLYAPGSATGRLGLLEFRAFEMPPHARMSLAQVLLLRAFIARFWSRPYREKLVYWDTRLHDEFMLPHFVGQDMRDVVEDLNGAGYAFRFEWFAPFLEFRFPRYGSVSYDGTEIELRQAIEPWHVLGEQIATTGMSRFVDSSIERLQVKATRLVEQRHAITCNGRVLPMTSTGRSGEFVAGVRFRAWAPPSALHPTIGIHAPLVFDLVDLWNGRSLGGCAYHVAHPGGRNYATFPVNAREAEARRVARFQAMGHTPGPMAIRKEARNPRFPVTLDLRKAPEGAA